MEGTLRMFLFFFVLLFVVNYASIAELHFREKRGKFFQLRTNVPQSVFISLLVM